MKKTWDRREVTLNFYNNFTTIGTLNVMSNTFLFIQNYRWIRTKLKEETELLYWIVALTIFNVSMWIGVWLLSWCFVSGFDSAVPFVVHYTFFGIHVTLYSATFVFVNSIEFCVVILLDLAFFYILVQLQLWFHCNGWMFLQLNRNRHFFLYPFAKYITCCTLLHLYVDITSFLL